MMELPRPGRAMQLHRDAAEQLLRAHGGIE